MTRKVIPKKTSDDDNYVTVLTGGPTKYYNRRRVRKVFAQLEGSAPFQPITSIWFTEMISALVSARHRQRISQMTVAGLLGTSQAAISRLESGKSNPTCELLDRLATALTVSFELTLKEGDINHINQNTTEANQLPGSQTMR